MGWAGHIARRYQKKFLHDFDGKTGTKRPPVKLINKRIILKWILELGRPYIVG
jgi:hypothetical protein